MTTSEHCLGTFKRNSKEFLRRFMTTDDTWIHHYMPEMKKLRENSRLQPANVLQRRRKRFHRPERSWPPFFGICKTSSSPTIWRREEQSRGSTMLIYRVDSRLNWWKNGHIWRRKQWSFTMTMTIHQLTHPQLPQPNWSNYATNCCLSHPILQIWPQAISFCSQI